MNRTTRKADRDTTPRHTKTIIDPPGPPPIIPSPEPVARAINSLMLGLRRIFSIDKAALIIYDREADRMCVTHVMSKGTVKSGLALTIPNRDSLLYQVLLQGFPVVDNCPRLIGGNIIERKILQAAAAQSVVIIPLIDDARRLGLLSLTSTDSSAFSTYLDGVGQDIVADFTRDLAALLDPSEIPA